MNIKRFVLIGMVAMLAIGLLACERPASQGPTGATTGTSYPVPGGTKQPETMGNLGTQTAIALNTPLPALPAATLPPAVTATPVPVVQPTQAQVGVPTATPGRPATYSLQKGEFPYCIARRFNVNPNDLLKLNGLNEASKTYPGQALKIPQAGSWPGERALKSHPATYTVKTNDTIYTVACLYGDVDPLMIALANGLADPYPLKAGDKIQIP